MKKSKLISAITAPALLAAGLVGIGSSPAHACSGETKVEVVSVDFITGGEIREISANSCSVDQLKDEYSRISSWTGMVGTGVASYFFGTVGGATATTVAAWGYYNQTALEDCSKAGTGVRYTEINGIVTGCTAQ